MEVVTVPLRDPEQRRAYMREYQRERRAGCPKRSGPAVPAPLRLETAEQVVELIGEQVNLVREDRTASTLAKARCIGYLASISLRAIEAGDLQARLEAVEAVLKERRNRP
jgi:hypothetical protein